MPVFITQYASLAQDAQGNVIPAGMEPAIGTLTVAIGASSTQSAFLDSATRFLEIATDAICHIKIGANPTATTSERRLPDESVHFVGISGDPTRLRVAVIQGT